MKVFTGKKVVVDGEVAPATIYVDNGKVEKIKMGYKVDQSSYPGNDQVLDAGNLVLMPGILDTHVHINEPGNTDWEGFKTGTKAAAAGGVTTLIDMPLNSIPITVSVDALEMKLAAARSQCYIDVGFWGGVIPGNQAELLPLVRRGVCGFKCFMIGSSLDDFPWVRESDLRVALSELQGSGTVVQCHAEVWNADSVDPASSDVTSYDTFLKTRPQSMEVDAIEIVCRLAKEYGVRCHIVHLSAAAALPTIREARATGAPITVETTPHYLCLDAETIPQMATQYKCCPPIRDRQNREALWEALKGGDIDTVASDHSPCTAGLKHMDKGDFITAYAGISSLQYGLSLLWTEGRQRGLTPVDLAEKLCQNSAKLCGLQDQKGAIREGLDADFVLWDPDASFTVEEADIHFKNKFTPYLGRSLSGKVLKTVVRGEVVYDSGKFSDGPVGELILLNEPRKP